MQPNLFPFGSIIANPFLSNGDLNEGLDSSRVLFLVPFLLFQGGGMDLSKVGGKFLSSVLSARSLGLVPSASDRPEVPARAAAAAAAARAIAGLPSHQRYSISSSSEELSSIYGRRPHNEVVEEVEDEFYGEDFDPVRYILEHSPSEENELAYFEKQAVLRLTQLDRVAERLSRQVMEHHEVMVKGMNLVRELEKDLKIANVICMNGRRHLTSSMNEVSRDLIVNSNSKKKQALLDLLAILNELRHALEMQSALESFVEEDNYCKAFQILSEYLQLLDSFSELSAMQEMGRSVEVWLGRTLQKLDALLLSVCQEFKKEGYITVVDAYALIGDVSGLAEKIQSFFMQEVISETHSVLNSIVQEDEEVNMHNSRLTYSDLCLQIPETKFRQCLLRTLAVLFKLMCSYQEIMDFQINKEGSRVPNPCMNCNDVVSFHLEDKKQPSSSCGDGSTPSGSLSSDPCHQMDGPGKDDSTVLNGESPWYHLRREATAVVSQTLQRGRRNLWQLTTSRISVLLSSSAACATSIHQFLRNYEDLNVFILAGEAFCGTEAVEFRKKLKTVCENYFVTFHRQTIHALKMVLEKETWMPLPPDTVQMVSFAGLVGDGAPLITSSNSTNTRAVHLNKSPNSFHTYEKNGFPQWLKGGNPFLPKVVSINEVHILSPVKWGSRGYFDGNVSDNIYGSPRTPEANSMRDMSDDENEDLLADFIDEDSQLPSRISKPAVMRKGYSHCNNEEITSQTGSSLSVLRSMDKYARLMQKLEIVNVEFFKGLCQLFELFIHFVYETFVHQSNTSGKGSNDTLNYRLRTALSRISQDCDQWIKPQSSSPTSLSTFSHGEVTPTGPIGSSFGHSPGIGLKERCVAADTVNLVTRILHRSRAHLLSMLFKSNTTLVEEFYTQLVDAVPDFIEHIHRTTARLLLHINGYADRIANTKWEVKELGLEHNGYVDLLLGEFKHYKTRLAHGGICEETQDLLLECGVEIVAETLVEGLSRVKKCTDEGRALMSLDLQVLINGLQHFVSTNVKPKLQMVETFIKAYYLPETEYVHWAQAHPEYTKDQIVGLINLVATMKGWKRKTRLEVIEKIE